MKTTPFRHSSGTGIVSLIALLCILPAAGGLFTACSADDRPQNVLLISIDTLRADRLSCYGYERPTSPAIDELAARGLLFENSVAQSPWTLPSHAAMLTGRFPHRVGMVDDSRTLPADTATLASILDENRFITGAFVNSHYLQRKHGFDRGFLTFEHVDGVDENKGQEITRKAIEWLDRYGAKSFFLFVHYYDVHSSYTPSAEFARQFTGAYGGPAAGTTVQLLRAREGELELSAEDIAHVSDLYDAEIRQLDTKIGRLLAHLKSSGLDRNTLVVLSADHGEEFLEHGGLLHGRTFYNEVVNVPLIMSGPGVASGRRVAGVSMLADIVPTLLGRLGIAHGGPFDGEDLFAGGEPDYDAKRERFVLAAADHNNQEPDIKRMVRNQRFKLLFNRLTGERELYDLVNDPAEKHDLSAERAGLADEFVHELERLMQGARHAGQIAPRSEAEKRALEKLGY